MTDNKEDRPVPVKIEPGAQPDEDAAGETAAAEAQQDDGQPAEEQGAAEAPDWKARYEDEHEKYLRALADLQNYRRRAAQEMAQRQQYANESLLAELLPVNDSCEQALTSISDTDDVESVAKGVEMILTQLQGFLKRHGIEEINAEGQPFDPDLHEAVEAVPTDEVDANTIIAVVQSGYVLHDRVLRAAKVRVAVAPEASSDS